jgi:gliding motility-associated-like protein
MTYSTVKNFLLTGLLLSVSGIVSAQLVVNNGALVAIKSGAQVIVKTGAVNNSSGTIDNAGTFIIEDYFENNDLANGGADKGVYRVQGDWINNATFTADSGQVALYGGNQLITGTAVTEFHNLTLTGTGVKTQTIDARVNSFLELNDRELATDGNKMFVLNPFVNAVTRSTGFVSSTGNGRLVREINTADDYLFPVGSSTGTARYRPITITPNNNDANTFEVRMANVDATTESFDRSVRENDICEINPNYYHLIGRPQGTDPVQVITYFETTETNWSQVVHWQNVPQWELTSPIVAGNSGGFRTLTITAWNDFTLQPFAFSIPSPNIDLILSKVKNPTCFGLTDGSIEVVLTTGTPPFTFGWSPNGQTTQDIFDLGAGNYNLAITDSNGCVTNVPQTFTLVEPAEILLSAVATDVLCNGGNNGALNLTVTNGIPNFDFAWSSTATTEDISGLQAGDYTVTVTDFNNCTKTETFTVEAPDQLVASLTPLNVSCYNAGDGGINTEISGGVPGYNYLWSEGGATTQDLSNLAGGTYAVTVTDNNGCTTVETVQVINPDQFVVVGSNDTITAVGYSVDLAVLSTEGGTPTFSYTWFNTTDGSDVGSGTEITNSPTENTYFRVVAVDENGCEAYDTVYVRVDVNLYDFPDGFAPSGTGVNRTFGIIASPVVELIEIKIFNRWGQLVFSGNGNNAKWDGTFNGKLQPMDTYVYQAQVQLPDGSREPKQGNVILVW